MERAEEGNVCAEYFDVGRGEQSMLVKKCGQVDKFSGDFSCCCSLARKRRQRIK